MSKEKKQALLRAIKRFLRVVVPQVPAFLSYLMLELDPQYTALLVFIGAVLTALDKFLRDLKVY